MSITAPTDIAEITLSTECVTSQDAGWLVVGAPPSVSEFLVDYVYLKLSELGYGALCQQTIGVYNNSKRPPKVIETVKYGTADRRFDRVFFVQKQLSAIALWGVLQEVLRAACRCEQSVAISLDLVFGCMLVEDLARVLLAFSQKGVRVTLAGTEEQVKEARRALDETAAKTHC